MGRKHAKKAAAKVAGSATPNGAASQIPAATAAPAETVGQGEAKRARSDLNARAPAEAAAAAASMAVDSVLLRCPEAIWAKLGCGALEAASCVRFALASRSFYAAAEASTLLRLHLALAGTQLWADSEHPGDKPFLTLSHLESLAQSGFVFAAARDLLRTWARAAPTGAGNADRRQRLSSPAVWFLDVASADSSGCSGSGGARAKQLCETIATLLLGQSSALAPAPEADENVAAGAGPSLGEDEASLAGHLAVLLDNFHAQEHWAPAVLEVVDRALGCLTAGPTGPVATEVSLGRAAEGSSLREMLLGVGQLLPATTAGGLAQAGEPVRPATLFCQLLERLVFPPRNARLVLRLSFNAKAACAATTAPAVQAATRAVEEALRKARQTGALEVVCLASSGRHYVLLAELESEAHADDGAESSESSAEGASGSIATASETVGPFA